MSSQSGRATLLSLRVVVLRGDEVICLTAVTVGSLVFVLRGHLQLGCTAPMNSFLRRVADVEVLDLREVELLRSEDGARSRDSDPADEGLRRDLIVLHRVDADQGARAAKSCLAVHSDGASVRLGEVGLTTGHELVNDGLGWRRTICENHVLVVDVLGEEVVAVVLGFVQAHHLVDVKVLEDVDVARSGMTIPMDGVSLVDGSHEGEEFVWDDPVEVSVLNLLVVLVFASIERLEVVPSEVDGGLETLEAVEDSALVVAVTATGISERLQVGLVVLELAESLMRVHLEDDYHEGAHEVGRVCEFSDISALSVVVDARLALERVALEQLLELTAVAMSH